MKLKQEFILRNIAGDNVLIPVSKMGDSFQGIISLNETGKVIWELIEIGKEKEEIVEELLQEYDVTESQALKHVEEFCDNLKKLGIL